MGAIRPCDSDSAGARCRSASRGNRDVRVKLMTTTQRITAGLCMGVMVAIAWFAYAPALGGVYLLDDSYNLAGLRSISDARSALHFVFSGQAGPLGRPISLATFVPQAASWGETAEPFLRLNILLHLLNACVVAWVLRLVTVACGIRGNNGVFVAIAGASVWLVMPLLASASLMIIQRMTTLSALLVLLGLGSYLWARQSLADKPRAALAGMTAALLIGTMLAVLAKESGALLPTYVLVMEATLLSRPTNLASSRWLAWKSVFLVLPTVMILAYLAWRFPYSQEAVAMRGFTGWERLLSEARILWEYLFSAFIPRAGSFGPFHDGYPVARSLLDPVTLAAVSSWVVISVLALTWRRRYPLFAFAVLWFLGGHLLESTTLPLLLYFEHRNYLPIVGPVFSLCALVVRVPASRKRLMYAGAAAYLLVNAFVLFGLSSLWGSPAQAFPYWQQRFPNSMFAATAALEFRLAAEGRESTRSALRHLVTTRPDAGYLGIYELRLSCMLEPQKDHSRRVAELERSLKHVDFSYSTVTMLHDLLEAGTGDSGCNGVNVDSVKRLADSVISNPLYRINTAYNERHRQLMALIAQLEGNVDQAIRHLEQAIEYMPSNALNEMMVVTYVAEKDFDAARAFVREARQNAPYNPMKRFVWLDKLQNLSQYIDEIEAAVSEGAPAVSSTRGDNRREDLHNLPRSGGS